MDIYLERLLELTSKIIQQTSSLTKFKYIICKNKFISKLRAHLRLAHNQKGQTKTLQATKPYNTMFVE